MVLDLWERKFSQIYWVQISFQSMYVFFSSCTACMFWLNQLCGKVMLSWNETEVKKNSISPIFVSNEIVLFLKTNSGQPCLPVSLFFLFCLVIFGVRACHLMFLFFISGKRLIKRSPLLAVRYLVFCVSMSHCTWKCSPDVSSQCYNDIGIAC